MDSQGKRRRQYWHSGHLNAVQMFDADGDGKTEIVVGGVRHGVERAVLMAFEPARVAGANRMPPNHPLAIIGKGPSTEKLTAVFGRSTLSMESGPFNWLEDLQELTLTASFLTAARMMKAAQITEQELSRLREEFRVERAR